MKNNRPLSIFLLCAIIFAALSGAFSGMFSISAGALEYPGLTAYSFVLADSETGKILVSQNENERVYPASTTKIMTVMLAVEAVAADRVGLAEQITASENVAAGMDADSSSAGIKPGEIMSFSDLLYCALVHSANDACNIIAERVSGSIPEFIDLMNARARQLGCVDTNFTNTHGMPDDNHYTTAHDLFLISRQAATYSLFNEIANTSYIQIPATNMSPIRDLTTTNNLINKKSPFYYEYASGIKTGHTEAAGYCLVSTAKKDDISLIGVVMRSAAYTENNTETGLSFSDMKALFTWGFSNFTYREVLKPTDVIKEVPVKMGAGKNTVSLRPESAVKILLPVDEDITDFERVVTVYFPEGESSLAAPILTGEILGEISLTYNGEVLTTEKLVSVGSVDLSKMVFIKSELNKTWRSAPVQIIFWVLVFLLVGYVVLVIRYRVKRQKHRRSVLEAKREREAGSRKTSEAEKPVPTRVKPQDSFRFVPLPDYAPSGYPAAKNPPSEYPTFEGDLDAYKPSDDEKDPEISFDITDSFFEDFFNK